jgi:hypothetical protein
LIPNDAADLGHRLDQAWTQRNHGLEQSDVLELRTRARSELINQLSEQPEPHRRSVSWIGRIAIDTAEIELGSSRGRALTKISDPRQLVDIAYRAS